MNRSQRAGPPCSRSSARKVVARSCHPQRHVELHIGGVSGECDIRQHRLAECGDRHRRAADIAQCDRCIELQHRRHRAFDIDGSGALHGSAVAWILPNEVLTAAVSFDGQWLVAGVPMERHRSIDCAERGQLPSFGHAGVAFHPTARILGVAEWVAGARLVMMGDTARAFVLDLPTLQEFTGDRVRQRDGEYAVHRHRLHPDRLARDRGRHRRRDTDMCAGPRSTRCAAGSDLARPPRDRQCGRCIGRWSLGRIGGALPAIETVARTGVVEVSVCRSPRQTHDTPVARARRRQGSDARAAAT